MIENKTKPSEFSSLGTMAKQMMQGTVPVVGQKLDENWAVSKINAELVPVTKLGKDSTRQRVIIQLDRY